jgi:hypothetical protein
MTTFIKTNRMTSMDEKRKKSKKKTKIKRQRRPEKWACFGPSALTSSTSNAPPLILAQEPGTDTELGGKREKRWTRTNYQIYIY